MSEKNKGIKKKYKYYEVVFPDGAKKRIPIDLIDKPVIAQLKKYAECNEIVSDLFRKSQFSGDNASELRKKISNLKMILGKLKVDLDTFNQNLTEIMSDTNFSKKVLMSLLENKSNLEILIKSETEKLNLSLCDKDSEKNFKNRLSSFVKSFDVMLDCDKERIVQSLFPKIVVEEENKLRIFLNPAFEGQDNSNSDN